MDHDRKFKEDLEKAQALSLESLALEKFRLEKQKASQLANQTKETNNTKILSQSQRSHRCHQSTYLDIISRPRPGSFNTKEPCVPRIRPPPQFSRRNSVTTTDHVVSSRDLISFNSPTSSRTVVQCESMPVMRDMIDSPENETVLQSPTSSLDALYSVIPNRGVEDARRINQNSTNSSKPMLVSSRLDESTAPPPLPPRDVLKVLNKKPFEKTALKSNSNLIDLTPYDCDVSERNSERRVRVSLLEAFDPLLTSSFDQTKRSERIDDEDQEAIYEPYDPFDFLYSPPSVDSQGSDPTYATLKTVGSPNSGPPLPPRNSTPIYATVNKHHNRQSRLYENIFNRRSALVDPELVAFHKLVTELRASFVYSNEKTNIGLVLSPKLKQRYTIGTSVKLIVHCSEFKTDVTFTCHLSSTIEHVLCYVACELGIESINNYILKVHGLSEYLECEASLSDYEFIHQCMKLDRDIELNLLDINSLQRPFLRTAEDDKQDTEVSLDDLLPKEPVQPISHESLLILLETLEKEIERVVSVYKEMHNTSYDLATTIQTGSVKQAVKAVCSLLGNIETLSITQAVDNFVKVCKEYSLHKKNSKGKPEIVEDSGDYSVIKFSSDSFSLNINYHCDQIRNAVQDLIQMYSRIFRVDFHLRNPLIGSGGNTERKSSEVMESLVVYIGCVHRLPPKWQYNDYVADAQLFYGTRPLSQKLSCSNYAGSQGFRPRIIFDSWQTFESASISSLPRESRIVFTIYGISLNDDNGQTSPQQIELGWSAIQLFDYNGFIVKGSHLLSLWPGDNTKRIGPAPCPGTHPHGDTDPIISIELPDYGGEIVFPSVNELTPAKYHDFSSLDHNTQEQLLDIITEDAFSNPKVEDREVLWEKRHYLLRHPQALPKVLLAAHTWDHTGLPDLHSMLCSWDPMDPVSALQLLLPCFPDNVVRTVAVSWIRKLSNDELVDYAPQLVQALKYENYEASALTKMLLDRSLSCPRVAHHLYWLLVHELPGETPQNTCDTDLADESKICEARYYRRLQLVLRALIAISGEALRKEFIGQQLLVKSLAEVADSVKTAKESSRLNVLMQGLQNINSSLAVSPSSLPLSLSLHAAGIQVRTSSYFPSNTLPLKVNFTDNEGNVIPAIFKVGDDLQQDMLTLQMIHLMDKLWLKEGLDLKMVTFGCVPTGHKKGMIEMVSDAETLRKIQVEFGLTGSFKDRPIAEWLAKHNPSALDYERAVHNFTVSCAGYCVATYVLGICDRHNDNIMLKTSGHLFHIDFGKFLGDAQMFGNFKRDRTPFVLTSDMAYVINGGDKPSARFHHFVDLCCQAFNIVRKEGNTILNLFGLMASSGAGGLTIESVRYVQKVLLPELTNAEAAATFARMIQSSLKSWFTQFNFFLHNLAQLRFSGDHNDGELLSFVPKVYSMQQDGRLTRVDVVNYQKRYDPEKYYIFILKVERITQPDPTYLFRSYKEFCELQHKLCIMFPLAKCYSLQGTSLHVGRSNIKQVAEKRMIEIKKFLSSLFQMADEICHSDLVYTFFHPLLRDQQEASIHEHKLRARKDRLTSSSSHLIKGKIKLSIHYSRETLWVMVHHVQELPCLQGGQEPSTYVKVYLLPDPTKATKRKTKVVRRNCHPSFMEMLEYRMPLDRIQQRYLQATVWNHDNLQENEFMGGTVIQLSECDLTEEKTIWYPLELVHR